MACEDTRQLTEAQRVAGYQAQRTGVAQAVRPFSGRPTVENLIDYINRELQPAVRQTRDAVNDVYLQVTDNAPSGNPLGFYFSDETGAADPTAGRIRLNAATQDTATIIRVSQSNARLVDVAPWLDVMAGGVTTPLGVVTLTDAVNPGRFIRFDLSTMTDQGVYWDLGVTPIESSHDNPFVDDGAVVLAFIPGVGGVTPATVPGTSISGADGPRQFLSTSTGTTVDFRTLSAIFPGAPIYDVMAFPFNAGGSLASDDTSAINAAIAAANATPGVIYLGPAHRITAALTTITGNNIWVVGRGSFNGGTILQVDSVGAVDVLTIDGPQYCGIRDVWIVGNRVYSGGFAIRIVDCFRAKLENILISQLCFGVEILRSALTEIERVFLSDLYGVYAFYAHGDATAENHAVKFINCVGGTDYNSTVVGTAAVWAAGQSITTGNIRFANGAIYQATTSGTTGATAPSGIPGVTVATAHTATVSDGGVSWKFSMPLCTWFLQGSYSHTFEVLHCGTLQGGYGLSVEDDAPGAGSTPLFTRVIDFQVDHPFSRGVRLAAGAAGRIGQLFVTSVLEGAGVEIGAAYSGNWEIIGGEIFGCNKEGVLIDAGNGVLADVQIGAVGAISSNTRDAIAVANSAQHFTITGCSAGNMFGASTTSRYGCSVAAGCDNYVIANNRFIGNLTGSVLNTPGRADTRVETDNIPDVELAVGSVWGLQIDHGASDVAREVTRNELGENLRRETVVVDSTSSGTSATYAIASTTTQVQFKLAGALTINGMTAATLTFGKLVAFSFDTGFAGSVTWNNESGSAGAALERVRTPSATALTISAGETAVFEYFDSRWRCLAVGKSTMLTDGDKGDITVSSSGTVWTIDAGVVTLAKQANLAQSRIVGRAEGAGTGVPTALTPTEVVAIIDAESPTWTGSHSFTGTTHTVAATGAVTMAGVADVSLASSTGGLALGAGHVVVSPSVGNLDVVMNATGGVAINAHATTPVTSAGTGNVQVTAAADVTINAASGVAINAHATTPVTTAATGVVAITASDDITLTAVDQVTVAGDSFILSTGGDQQLQVEPSGTWLVGSAADSGSFGDVFTSQGPSAPPVWQPSGLAGMTALTEHTNTAAVFAAFTAPTIPANSWAAGTVYEFVGELEIDAGTTTTSITIDIGVTGGSNQDLVIAGNANVNMVLSVRGFLTCLTTGAGGTCMIVLRVFSSPNGDADIDVSDSCAIDGNADRTSVALDTTVSNTLFMTSKFASAIANLRHTWQAAFVRKVM